MTKSLQTKQPNQISTLNQEQIDVIKNTIAKDASDAELQLFITQCNRTQLDPFSRQIYFAKSKDNRPQINATIDGFRVIAERSGKYQGQLGPFWCGTDGEWKDVWLQTDPPKAAKVGVLRADFQEPLWGVATWDGYAQKSSYGLIGQWAKNGSNQLAKCAESLALRKAFPQDLSGLYTTEEMETSSHAEVDIQTPKNEVVDTLQDTEMVEEVQMPSKEEEISSSQVEEAFLPQEEEKPFTPDPKDGFIPATAAQLNLIEKLKNDKKVGAGKVQAILLKHNAKTIEMLGKGTASFVIQDLMAILKG